MSKSLFGPQCSSKLVSLNGTTFANYFSLNEQYSQATANAAIAAGCDENLFANWKALVKHEIINCGGEKSMLDFMTNAFPMGGTTAIEAKNKYFKAQCAMNWNIQAASPVSGIAGADVTFQLARKDHGPKGETSPVAVGQRLLLKNDNTPVEITAVNRTTPNAYLITVRPSPDYAITITANNPMMVLPAPQVNTNSCFTDNTRLPSGTHIYKMGMKSIRMGWMIPYDANLHCDVLQFAKGIDPNTGLQIDMWTTQAKEDARADMLLTKHTDFLFGVPSTDQTLIDNCIEGFQGLIPSIRYGGGNVMSWNPIYGLDIEVILSTIISQADQTKSFKEYFCTCGFQFYAQAQKALYKIIGNNPGACTYQTFMRNGAVDMNYVEQYQIKSWSFLGYTFHFRVEGAFSDMRIVGSNNLNNTAVFYPSQRVKDSSGNDVPPIDIYTFTTPGYSGEFVDQVRDMFKINGCTEMQGDLMETYGMVTHCLKDWFLLTPKAAC
jgi:hypothetical protein